MRENNNNNNIYRSYGVSAGNVTPFDRDGGVARVWLKFTIIRL